MSKLMEKIKQLIRKVSGIPEQQEEKVHIKNTILHDISDIELQDIEPESERVINISNKQFGTNNVVREMTEDDAKEIQRIMSEMKQKMQKQNASRSSKEFRNSYQIKEGTTIKDGNVTINFGKGNVVGNGNVMRNSYKEER